MTYPVSVVVQSCPKRAELAQILHDKLVADAPDGVKVLGIAWDNDHAGPWASAKKAWAMAEGEHHLVMQEDVLLCPGFLDAAKMLLGLNPGRVVSFYTGTAGPVRAREAGVHWLEERDLSGQAIALPRGMPAAFLAWEAAEPLDKHPNWRSWDDLRLTSFLQHHKHRVRIPVPCLVQHDLQHKSTMGTPAKVFKWPRESRWFIGEGSPFEIDWGLGLDQPAR